MCRPGRTDPAQTGSLGRTPPFHLPVRLMGSETVPSGRGGAPGRISGRNQLITVTVSAMFFEAFFSQEIFTFSPAFSFDC